MASLSSTTKTMEHAADEAGGETIFSSDGMAPLATPKVPVICQKDNIYDNLTSLDTDNTSTPVLLLPSKESTCQKLQRLQKEVQELQRDQANQEQVQELARDLAGRLQTSTTFGSAQEELLRKLEEHWKDKEKTAESSGVVYELYGGTVVSPSSSSLEERLLHMERLVGSSTTSTSTSLLQRMEKVETMANRVNEKALDEAAVRAKVIRADLEAASKARAKLGSAGMSTTDTKQITELYDQLQQLEGIGQHLPALAIRLQQLATLHTQGATFANRLQGVEQAVPQLQASLKELQSSLTKVEEGMRQNLEMVQTNMNVLEQRLNETE